MVIKIGVVGASGRTGSKVVSCVLTDPECELGAAIVSPKSEFIGMQISSSPSQIYRCELSLLRSCDAVIDFSNARVSCEVSSICAQGGVPLLVATTGISEEERLKIESAARDIPLCCAPNTSLGAALLGALAVQASMILGEDFDCEVAEIHHRHKRDAPSGTAHALVSQILGAKRAKKDSSSCEAVFGRAGLRRDNEIGVVSLRGGDEPGEHTVYFFGPSERIEISHKVKDRGVFATGAVQLIKRLVGRPPGLYTPQMLLLQA